MRNYYQLPVGLFVRTDEDTKEVVNVLNSPIQKTISKLNNPDYYDKVTGNSAIMSPSDSATFDANYQEVMLHISGLI